MKINLGMKDEALKKIATGLSHLLADTYLLYLKTQNFHWNVTSPYFQALHKMFEEQYEELADAVDVIAERIRALGQTTPASFAQFLKLTRLKEATQIPNASEMIKQLLADHEQIICELRPFFGIAEDLEDQATADLIAERIREHEKIAWMLRSSI